MSDERYEIIIRDKETGEVEIHNTDYWAACIRDKKNGGFWAKSKGETNSMEAVTMAQALDSIMEKIFKRDPLALGLYLFSEVRGDREEIDLTELKKRMEGFKK